VKIFHEARQQSDPRNAQQWKDARIAFEPTYMFALRQTPTALPGRIVLGRMPADGAHSQHVVDHPLLIDADTLTVEVADQSIPARAAGVTSDGRSLFWVHADESNPWLWRWSVDQKYALPVEGELFSKGTCFATVYRSDTAMLLFQSDKVLSSAAPGGAGPYRAVGAAPESERDLFPVILQSQHYGMIWKTLSGKLYAIETH
jgi:hypothetical protein